MTAYTYTQAMWIHHAVFSFRLLLQLGKLQHEGITSYKLIYLHCRAERNGSLLVVVNKQAEKSPAGAVI